MSITEFFDKFGVDDWRGIIMLIAMILVGYLSTIGQVEFAEKVFLGLVVLAAQYFFSKSG